MSCSLHTTKMLSHAPNSRGDYSWFAPPCICPSKDRSVLPVGTKLTVVPLNYMDRTEAIVEANGIRILNKPYIIGLMTPQLFFSEYAFGGDYYPDYAHRMSISRRETIRERNYVRMKIPGDRKRYIFERGDAYPLSIAA